MEIVDKVHIKLSKTDVEKILKDHFRTYHKIDLKNVNFVVDTKLDEDTRYSSYSFIQATGEGSRII